MDEIKRGDILLIDFDPSTGSEQFGKRPALVIQNDVGNKYSPVIIVVPITTKKSLREFPTNLNINQNESNLDYNSTALFNQIMTIDKSRIIKKYGFLNNSYDKKIDLALIKSLAIDCSKHFF